MIELLAVLADYMLMNILLFLEQHSTAEARVKMVMRWAINALEGAFVDACSGILGMRFSELIDCIVIELVPKCRELLLQRCTVNV